MTRQIRIMDDGIAAHTIGVDSDAGAVSVMLGAYRKALAYGIDRGEFRVRRERVVDHGRIGAQRRGRGGRVPRQQREGQYRGVLDGPARLGVGARGRADAARCDVLFLGWPVYVDDRTPWIDVEARRMA